MAVRALTDRYGTTDPVLALQTPRFADYLEAITIIHATFIAIFGKSCIEIKLPARQALERFSSQGWPISMGSFAFFGLLLC